MKYIVKFSTEFVIEYDTKNKIYYPVGDVPQNKGDEVTIRSMANFDIERSSVSELIDMSNGQVETCVKWVAPQLKPVQAPDDEDKDDGPLAW